MPVVLQDPFQTITFLPREHAPDLLVTSAGAKLYSYAAESGERLASWPQDVDANGTDAAADAVSETQGPPEKRRKVSESSAQAVESSKPASDSPKQRAWSNIPIVTVSSSGEYVVALTSEDKCVRVFQLNQDGTFNQLSERSMPKRPCSIILAGEAILVADKFGDVYSLPLHPSDKPYVPSAALRGKTSEGPVATNLTVHTKRNLKSLQQQLEYQQQEKQHANEKTTLNFEHQIILGHVSMLTDILYVSLPVDSSSDRKRTYLLSADRDEHIRVSRGPPQAHIVENYCLGHTAFITQLCVPQWAPEYLISGGGDNYLLVWRWTEGHILQKVPLVDAESDATIAVRAIWAFRVSDAPDASGVILVAIEGSSQLRCFVLGSDGKLTKQAPIQASGNVLDVTTIDKDSTILVSVDSIRKADSTQEWNAEPSSILLEAFRVKSEAGSVTWEPSAKEIVEKINFTGTAEVSTTDTKQQKELNESLYNLGSLRKRGDE
ncbi:hypothetical protein BDV59DRAFT_1719 [Aspergillus ambiguus]|uniref:putative tRNA methyltransferase n=1 Tax=Aspergillus ambiguus TaxID=176160 RepID=UPI003CCE1CC2